SAHATPHVLPGWMSVALSCRSFGKDQEASGENSRGNFSSSRTRRTIPSMNTLCITGGRIIDPSQGIDQIGELWIRGENILGIGPQPQLKADQPIDAASLIVCPGLIDMHVHLREPGREEDETIETGTAAALAGGVTSVACMPNTEPA